MNFRTQANIEQRDTLIRVQVGNLEVIITQNIVDFRPQITIHDMDEGMLVYLNGQRVVDKP